MLTNEPLALPAYEEAPASFLRLLKIFWSGLWRELLLLIPLWGLIYLVGLDLDAFLDPFTWVQSSADNKLVTILGVFVLGFLVDCLVFKWIIGLQYKDFRLDFTPSTSSWNKIFRVSIWYYMLTWLLDFTDHRVQEILLPLGFEQETLPLLTWPIITIINIFLIKYVVNRSYGDVRLSLLKTKRISVENS